MCVHTQRSNEWYTHMLRVRADIAQTICPFILRCKCVHRVCIVICSHVARSIHKCLAQQTHKTHTHTSTTHYAIIITRVHRARSPPLCAAFRTKCAQCVVHRSRCGNDILGEMCPSVRRQ